jgi:protein ImuA
MGDAAGKIARLRTVLTKAGLENPEKHARIPLGCASADNALKGGLLKGALHEVYAEAGHEAAASGFALTAALRLLGHKALLWIRPDFSALEYGELAATGLLELGADPARVLTLHVADASDAVRAAGDALSCAALGAVVVEILGEPKNFDLVISRRLTLAAAECGVSVFLLRFRATLEGSTAETRWRVRAARSPINNEDWGKPGFETELVRNRHGSTGQWVMEWNCDNGLFQERPADRSAMVSAAFDRPSRAAMEGRRGFRPSA